MQEIRRRGNKLGQTENEMFNSNDIKYKYFDGRKYQAR